MAAKRGGGVGKSYARAIFTFNHHKCPEFKFSSIDEQRFVETGKRSAIFHISSVHMNKKKGLRHKNYTRMADWVEKSH